MTDTIENQRVVNNAQHAPLGALFVAKADSSRAQVSRRIDQALQEPFLPCCSKPTSRPSELGTPVPWLKSTTSERRMRPKTCVWSSLFGTRMEPTFKSV